MASKPKKLDPPPSMAVGLIGDFFVGSEMGTFDLKDWQFDIARRSPAFRALIRSGEDNPGYDNCHKLTSIWHKVGQPEGRSPLDWRQDPKHGEGFPAEGIEDQGEGGFFADWETAVWYVHFLDRENFSIGETCSMLY